MLGLVLAPFGWAAVGAVESKAEPFLSLQAVTCSSWSDIPANSVPDSSHDDTDGGWQRWGPPGEDNAEGRCAALAGVSFRLTATLGGQAVDADSAGFVTPGLEDGISTTAVGPTGSDGLVRLAQASLTASQQDRLHSPDGLWVSAVGFSGRFGTLRCPSDRMFADNLEVLRNLDPEDSARCVLYAVGESATPVVTAPVVTAPVVSAPVVVPPPIPNAPIVATKPELAVPPVEPPPASEPAVVVTTRDPAALIPVLPPTVKSETASQPTPVAGRRPGTVVVFLEVVIPPPSLGAPRRTPVAVEVDCGLFGTRRLFANEVNRFAAAEPIEVTEATRCGVRPTTEFLTPPQQWQPFLTVSGHEVAAGESLSLVAGVGEQTVVAVRLMLTDTTSLVGADTLRKDMVADEVTNDSANVLAAGQNAPRSVLAGADENAFAPLPQPLAAPTQLILGATFGLGLLLALLAARRNVKV